jgi:hypothetical protein
LLYGGLLDGGLLLDFSCDGYQVDLLGASLILPP